ncbi:XTP/dITP diphosphohydrolase [Deinobacterium chartae]|uniref:XTP/dITP diphosphohydrolase n=1 Tax=Deinobacterium chartae TaxID=521158 RepID=A0A841I3E9_9DEIO|nr:MazG family protein [Deinobacterium chartae]MBB6098445.1 XTP/dITP diphosphohydrolase [Deinobacterium chartae]
MQRLLEIMRTLRAPEGCPWDREQTHLSLRPYLLEEAAEAVDAASSGDMQELASELGDVLLQIAFHSVIAEEAGAFAYTDVENAICEKMVRRHPHVFGDVTVDGAEQVLSNWEAIKRLERGGAEKHPLERIPSGLGALEREKLTQKALRTPKSGREEVLTALQGARDDEASVAAVLEAVVAWARSLDVDPELALRARTARKAAAALEARP